MTPVTNKTPTRLRQKEQHDQEYEWGCYGQEPENRRPGPFDEEQTANHRSHTERSIEALCCC